MPQLIKRSAFGDLNFIRTWVNGNMHIGNLVEGGYAHLGGMPVTMKSELEDTIPKGKFLDEALLWFANKDKVKTSKEKKKRIMVESDGSYVFEDGSPIMGVGDLFSSMPIGPALDAAVVWFVAKAKGISQDKVTEKELSMAKMKEISEANYMCNICGKVCKTAVALSGHKRSHPAPVPDVPVTASEGAIAA